MKQGLAIAVFAAISCLSITSQAKETSFGKAFGGWTFTQEKENDGLVNCRAHYDGSGSGHFIIATRTNDVGYVSIDTPKRLTGTYSDGLLTSGFNQRGVQATVFGKRLVFGTMSESELSDLMGEGYFKWEIPSRKLSGEVDVGTEMIGEVLARLSMCVAENKARSTPTNAKGQVVENDAYRMGEGCPKIGKAKSPTPIQPTRKVTFYNQSEEDLPATTLYWLNPDGEPVETEIFDERGKAVVDSYDGAKYIAKDFSGTCYGGTLTVKPGQTEVIVQ